MSIREDRINGGDCGLGCATTALALAALSALPALVALLALAA